MLIWEKMKAIKKILKRIKLRLLRFQKKVTNIINSVLLFFVYFLGVGLVALVARILKKKFIQKGSLNDVDSYWTKIKKSDKDSYYQQY